ncbi:MAG: arylesterase [Rhodocyclaceae bacterium]|nr:arylesterase [Rhodocyclaceae bacterium]MBP6279940.1 arylesterase [Rhodocyclaceae bacterium]
MRMLRWLSIAIIFSAISACSKPPEQALPRGTRVLALGDSLTAGNGVLPAEAWPSLLAANTGWEIINGGVSGDTSAGGLARLPDLLDEHSPTLVFVSLGGNDMLRRVPQADTVANLNRILDLVQAKGAKAVLLATPKPSITGAVFSSFSAAEFYRPIADAHKIPLIENALPEVLSDTKLKVDALHPNVAGHLLLTKKITAALKEIGYVR